jgi:CheY-like chemotaxis protein
MSPRRGDDRALSVLIADDHRDGADSLALLLAALGHRVAVARTGPEVLAAAARDRPDAVVMELRLPDLDGWEVARRLRAGGCPARLVAVTTHGRPADRERSRAAGIDVHLLKPADPAVLLAVLVGSGSRSVNPVPG